jgi:hypothetical protein
MGLMADFNVGLIEKLDTPKACFACREVRREKLDTSKACFAYREVRREKWEVMPWTLYVGTAIK